MGRKGEHKRVQFALLTLEVLLVLRLGESALVGEDLVLDLR